MNARVSARVLLPPSDVRATSSHKLSRLRVPAAGASSAVDVRDLARNERRTFEVQGSGNHVTHVAYPRYGSWCTGCTRRRLGGRRGIDDAG